MGANIYFKQVKGGKSLDVDAPSSFIESMNKAFGDSPWRLTAEEVPILKGMAAMSNSKPNPYSQLIEAIGRLDEIEVWPQW